ncbi:Undecaprenyl-phosphate glucose phosphotransferase [Trinickia symbiotica]|uniref:undecaprenyl-phosphate glucose phosphotransferase n=1 Tax=Trinickia symbiotica TaxID=863227 RepID=UPI0003682752|nr:undecaprenyl-phosphate glucose phosphotransferase [Trinickia symbiotica]PPK45409.1 Undecaprenyl-phosphate glucose phosphotransferase [Trinickia symbiotica]
MRDLQGLCARLIDVVLIIATAVLASEMRFSGWAHRGFTDAFALFTAAFALVLFPVFGVYESWRGRSKRVLAGQVALAWLVVQACALMVMFSLRQIDFVSRLWFAYWTALAGGLLIAYRLASHAVLARLRHAGMNLHQVALVGSGHHCNAILRRIQAAPATGFRASAIYVPKTASGEARVLDAASADASAAPSPLGLPLALRATHAYARLDASARAARTAAASAAESSGSDARMQRFDDIESFAQCVRTSDVHELWLALPLSEERTILSIIGEFRNDLVNIRFMPDVRSLALFDTSGIIDLLGVPAINLIASPLSPSAMMKKDLFDRVFAACALIGLAPLMIAIAIAVKLSSPGPVFFKQKRKGADGRVFTIYKFRSMRLHVEEPGVVKQAVRQDPRVTKIGAFLRRTSLDELPQFINVLKGDMSVVGPRPHALEHDDLYQKVVAGYIHRYRIKPGITGWAQINGYRGETDRIEKMERRVAHDLYYLGNWSFGLDMRIIAATVVKGLIHSNAY